MKNTFILVYHGISNKTTSNLEVNLKTFKKQIQHLISKNFQFVSSTELLSQKRNKTVSLHFDDGLSSAQPAFDFLIENNFPFGIAIISNKIGKNGYLNWDQIHELHQSGLVEIFSHTNRHLDLTSLNKEELQSELSDSKQQIKHNLSIHVTKLVYPFGLYNQTVQTMSQKQGYKYGFSLLPFCIATNNNPMAVPRINVNGQTSEAKFKLLVSPWGKLYLRMAFIKRLLFQQSYLK